MSSRTGSANSVHSGEFQPVELIAGRADCGVLFVCDHASNALPPEFGSLGLPEAEFRRHIAFDIGAADMTRALARQFGAPAILTGFSRLLIDANRGDDDPTLVMKLSDGAIIPGNAAAGDKEVEARRARYWRPYREAVRRQLDLMSDAGCLPAIVSLHSFTPVWRGAKRPWRIGLLWDNDRRLALALLEALEAAGFENVGDNEPYDGALIGDTMYEHGTSRGLAHVLIELRQDLIETPEGAADWAGRIASPLELALSQPQMHRIEFHGSRAGTGRRPHLRQRSAP